MNPYLLHMPHWPKPVGIEPSGTACERTRTLLARLGHPELKLPPLVHVGGTKGKGSTIAFLRTMLAAAGYKVHTYTSPHLARFNERIVLAGSEIDDVLLQDVLEETRMAAGDMPVGFFDATTAAAVLAFARIPADILLMEMGLGGTVDATNILDAPRLTILTTVSYDHMEYMGQTLPEIARFEAGLFKPHVPCVASFQHESVWPALAQVSTESDAPLYAYGLHWRTGRTENSLTFADVHGEVELPLPALLGPHQIVNAGNAIAALSVLTEFDVKPEHIVQGLQNVRWKGRLEQLPAMLPHDSEIWFDGGHNMAAGQVIALFATENWDDKPFYLIFGTTQGKDVTEILAPFKDVAARVYAVEVKSEPKSYSAQAIVEVAARVMQVQAEESIADALQDIASRESGAFRVLVFGSLYLWLEAEATARATINSRTSI